ncbi:MAG TPA: hypothetical protein VM009_03310 [Terriglobales bacterium]|nr:hypothetical protein [Terriglobales bacterium]
MKLGFDNKRELAIMAAVVLLAVFLVSRIFIGGAPVVTANKPALKTATQAGPPPPGSRPIKNVLKFLKPSLDPSLRFDLLRASEEVEYEGGKRNIFREHVEVVRIDKPITPVIPQPPPQKVVDAPPPIPLKFYGFASRPGEARRVFLSNGDEVFIAEEGQIIQRRYKVVKINATAVEVEDVLNNNKQIIPITQG